MAEIEFQVEFDGDGITAGRFPVRDLAPSLLALANLFRDAKRVVDPEGTEIRLEMRETERGSYIVQLFLLHVGESVRTFFYTDDASALANFLEVVGTTVALFVWVKNHGRFTRTRLPNGNDQLTAADGDTLEVSPEVVPLYEEPAVLEDAHEVVEPLNRDGIDSFKIRRNGLAVAAVTAEDVDAFALPLPEEVLLLDVTSETMLQVHDVPLGHPRSQWRFRNSEHGVIAVSIDDEGFLEDIAERSEPFRAGDILRCDMRTMQYRKPDGDLRADYTVVKVSEHIPMPRVVSVTLPPVEMMRIRDVVSPPERPAGSPSPRALGSGEEAAS